MDLLVQGLLGRETHSSVVPHLLEYVNNSCTQFHATGKHEVRSCQWLYDHERFGNFQAFKVLVFLHICV